ncbi:hypothetical protein K2Q16_00870 [Patescibacteria group bacterium]|nr:hypothetical protein [Patescibacteria group bacterium]
MNTKSLMVVALALLLLGTGAFYFLTQAPPAVVVIDDVPATTTPNVPFPANAPEIATSTATTTRNAESVLGISAGGTEIKAYHFGTGSTELLFIGGIHGGYSANTTLVAYELMNHLKDNPELVPKNVTVTVIPAFNADGLMATVKTTGVFNASALPKDQAARVAGRFNKNTVDLNRNFDCEWEAEGTWQNRTVSGGGAAFSEPEAAALRDYVATYRPTAVVAWYSAAGGVFASNCGQGVSSGTTALMNTFAKASGYPAYASFDYYEITGDMMNWFAKLEVPAVSVLLSTHEATEWEKNRRGIEAVLASYAE